MNQSARAEDDVPRDGASEVLGDAEAEVGSAEPKSCGCWRGSPSRRPRSACPVHVAEYASHDRRLAEQLAEDEEYGHNMASGPEAWSVANDAKSSTRGKFALEKLADDLCFEIQKLQEVHVSPLTDGEWVGLLNHGGEFLPACCANVSEFRDVVHDALRSPIFYGPLDSGLKLRADKVSTVGLALVGSHPELVGDVVARFLEWATNTSAKSWRNLAAKFDEDQENA